MKLATKVGAALLFGLICNELGVIAEWAIPNADQINAGRFFIDKSYHVTGLSMPYYLYELAGNWYKFIIFACFYSSVRNTDRKLSYVVAIFLFYHFIEVCFYIYNRNTSFWNNFSSYVVMAVVILEILVPSKRLAIIKRI